MVDQVVVNAVASPPPLFERVRLLTIQPPDYPYVAALAELRQGVGYAFAALGSTVDATVNEPLLGEGVNVVFGAHLVEAGASLPANSVIVNTEPMRGGESVKPHYYDLLARHPVLDYSTRNASLIAESTGNRHVQALRIGYSPNLTRIESAPEPDVDVLFYGNLNPRRAAILRALEQSGLRLKVLRFVYGPERDAWIARSKLVLNVHFYEDQLHEVVRTSYLLANRKCVVSECGPDTEIDAEVRDAIVAVPYERIVETCVELARDDERRRAIAQAGFERFSRLSQADALAETLPRLSSPLPTRINLGSGKSFDSDQFNIDIDPKWQPDLLYDLTAPAGLRQIGFSARFGLVRLEADRFDEITTMDVLEHVPQLVRLMTHCLELLRVGGTMRIGVPYDLSYGAWQDPTHIRAFNENSWRYYTEWHWYLGWMQARFEVTSLHMALSPYGESLRKRGVADEEIQRTPRAVDSMQVVLTKCLLTEQEIARARQWHRGDRAEIKHGEAAGHPPSGNA